ncbi:hypothetical protein IV203_006328 [Nitzschia inconspicua]|uniref:Uncharacterized protein n=1 Tax=Nitzschia inconspicua TaxID=303405 RepID=A0A9K3K854_9STRA|nr:hypothetical protein IV203_006328 [Nitzschia inconspicua]
MGSTAAKMTSLEAAMKPNETTIYNDHPMLDDSSIVDDEASKIDENSGTTESDDGNRPHRLQHVQLAAHETKTVRRLKYLVFTLLFCSMVAVALTAYHFTTKQEIDEFEKQYYENADKVLGTMGKTLSAHCKLRTHL